MKFKIEFELEKVGEDCYYFSIGGIPYRVWRVGNVWCSAVFSGTDCIQYPSMTEAINNLVLNEWDNDSHNYKRPFP